MPSRDLDDVLPLYAPLGFDVTYSQERANPYAAVHRGGIELHFFSVSEFDPADSMGSVVVLVPDTEALHTTFAAGLRTTFGRLPASGVPRMTRPRRRQGALGGVTVVDPRATGRRSAGTGTTRASLGRHRVVWRELVAAAARQADSPMATSPPGIRVLDNWLARHTDTPPAQRLPWSTWGSSDCVPANAKRRPPCSPRSARWTCRGRPRGSHHRSCDRGRTGRRPGLLMPWQP